jgi:hypothetical protein
MSFEKRGSAREPRPHQELQHWQERNGGKTITIKRTLRATGNLDITVTHLDSLKGTVQRD